MTGLHIVQNIFMLMNNSTYYFYNYMYRKYDFYNDTYYYY